MDSLEGKGSFQSSFFSGKHVILGASAAGISNLKATSASSLTDDNEILATALDDAINNTSLQTLPSWVITVLAILFVFFLAYLFDSGRASEEADMMFAAIEVLAILIMFFAISYTTNFIDISPIATYGLIYFTVAKVHQGFTEKVIKGAPNYIKFLNVEKPRLLAVMAFEKEYFNQASLKKIYEQFVKTFGDQSVFLCFDVFEGDTILSNLKDVGCLAVLDVIENKQEFIDKLNSVLGQGGSKLSLGIYEMSDHFDNDAKMLEYIGQKILAEVSQKVS